MRVGIGYAILPFEPGRVLMLGGVKVPGAWGLRGRSDGDVLLQAVADGLLGAAALGDLGDHFPVEDPQWRDVPSAVLLAEALARLRAKGLVVTHVDITVVCERPDLRQMRGAMRARLATLLSLEEASVSVKSVPAGGLGALGDGQGIAALAAVSVADTSV